jgi:hypothetical protein
MLAHASKVDQDLLIDFKLSKREVGKALNVRIHLPYLLFEDLIFSYNLESK